MSQKGFSLIELMMVIVIVSVASTIVIAQYSNSRNSKALSLGAKQVANDVKIAQNYALGALDAGGTNPGYGIRFSNSFDSYIIFADKDNNKAYDGAGEEFQTVKLPDGVTIQSLRVDGIDISPVPVDVVFTSPYGEVYINDANKNGVNFIILKVKIENPAGAEIISISSSGKIN
ncbi:prepilin-type N-terminal cleavage/methylation domain-containing protein [Candidatus Parcubacteria bacterium]|nr:prepilin-type N-terminal cleavage/methylation domain-containing protein [Candidatus Parcubacteria bacterium]